MASVSVSASLPTEPGKTWDALSDLAHWEDWLTIHQAWKSELPSDLAVGARTTEVVLGMANKIGWAVTELEAPKTVTITGAMIVGPIGKAVDKNAKGDLEVSLAKFVELRS